MREHRFLYWASLVLCTAALLFCGGALLRQLLEYRTGEITYESLARSVTSAQEAVPAASDEPVPPEEPSGAAPAVQVDFEALSHINPDVVGWLYCQDTIISYPVVQGTDNDYYLTHLFDGTRNSAGCLFLDSRCDGLAGPNSIIYGHYLKNGTQFSTLKDYQDQAYYEAHPDMLLLTPEGTLTIQWFSAYVTGTDADAWQLAFATDAEYGAWLERLKERSCFESTVTPQASDRVVTLSTCNYTFPDARFVCHGVVREN